NKYDGKQLTYFTEREGLSNDFVRSIIEDRSGNIWFGTDAGISKYDGKNFTHFTEKQGLSHNVIRSILQDRKGDIWFGTDGGGVCKFDGSSFFHFTEEEGLANNVVSSIFEDRSGSIWFGTFGGISIFHGSYFTQLSSQDGLVNDVVRTIVEDRSGNVWFGTDGGLSRYDLKSFTNFTDKEGLSDKVVFSAMEDFSGRLWCGTYSGGVCKYNGNYFTHFTEKEGLSSNVVKCISSDRTGTLWFGTFGGGINRYDGSSFEQYTEKEGLSSNFVLSILQDRFGNHWFGTSGGGVTRYDGNSFIHFTMSEGLSSNTVFSILEDRAGNLWFGTDGGGVCKYDGKSFARYTISEGMSSNIVYAITEDRKGVLWFGTDGGGVVRYDGNSFLHLSVKDGLADDVVSDIAEDRNGNIWFATDEGVSFYRDGNFVSFTEEDGLSNNVVYTICEDSSGDLWFGTRNGLCRMIDPVSRFGQLKSDKKDFAYQDVLFKCYTYDDGFLSIGMASLCQDHSGKLWIGADDRLTLFHYPSFEKDYDRVPPRISINGLSLFNEKISWAAIESNKDTTIDLASGVKLGHLNFDETRNWSALPDHLRLSHDQNYLTFQFAGITMNQTYKVKYKYKLDGLDDNWSSLSNRNYASFGNLLHGDYVFKVKAMNAMGFWSDECQYPFTIRPPWWKTYWAYGSYFIFIGFTYVGAIRWNSRRLRKRTLVLKAAVDDATAQLRMQRDWEVRQLQDENRKNIVRTQEDERVRIGRDLHDDLGARLSTLKLMLQSVFRKEGSAQEPVRESSISLLDSAISDMRSIITNLSPKALQENGYLKAVEELVASVSKTEAAKFELSMHGMDRRFDSEFENSIFRITQELINNSLKYAKASLISINTVYRDGKVVILYEDNGAGFDADKVTRGYGLNNIRSRAELYGGEFYIDTAPGKGFRCEVTLVPPASAVHQHPASGQAASGNPAT
ncbi:MAG: hypothetical protein RL213_859, partial [Bacteroidota bacterium]